MINSDPEWGRKRCCKGVARGHRMGERPAKEEVNGRGRKVGGEPGEVTRGKEEGVVMEKGLTDHVRGSREDEDGVEALRHTQEEAWPSLEQSVGAQDC